MKIEKEFTNETIRYETVGSDHVFLKRNINRKGEVSKERLINVRNVKELSDNLITTVRDAFKYFIETKGFKYVEKKR